MGVASRIDIEEGELVANFDGREVTYGFGELDELVLAYARESIKAKARNTSRRNPAQHSALAMLQRNLVYTVVTSRGGALHAEKRDAEAAARASYRGGWGHRGRQANSSFGDSASERVESLAAKPS
jgi:exodeoxyribonuclease V alpha subunit